ncbi:MAG: EXPERA domain-containing protein [Polyangia bacterium]
MFAGLAVLWDFSWCFVFRALQAADVDHGWRRIWALYGRVDSRYLQGDPWLVILEIMTGLIGTTLSFYVVHQLRRGSERRARVALFIVSVTQIYGAVMYWGSELFSHFAHVDPTHPLRTSLLFVGLNSLWVIFPGWCLYHLVSGYARAPGVELAERAPRAAGSVRRVWSGARPARSTGPARTA